MKGIESTIAPNCPRNLHGWAHPEHLCYFGEQYCEHPATNAPECWRKYNAAGGGAMKEYPILFSAPLVRAILDGCKTVTRRLPPRWLKVRRGDQLWVRETWRAIHVWFDPESRCGEDLEYARKIPESCNKGWWHTVYAATDPRATDHPMDRGFPWRPSIHMPRWVSRITLEATEDARQEPLHAITRAEIGREGTPCFRPHVPGYSAGWDDFAILWDSLHDKPGERWADGPDVVRIAFRVVEIKE